MTLPDLLKIYDKIIIRACKDICHGRSATTPKWCHTCPLWEHREDLEKLERMEDDGK